MNITTLMKELSELLVEHGDIEVGYYNDYETRFVEVNQVWFKESDYNLNNAVIDNDARELEHYFIAID